MKNNRSLLMVTAFLVVGALISVGVAADLWAHSDSTGPMKPETQAQAAHETPLITSARMEGKNLIVLGEHFDEGSRILINDNPSKTRTDLSHPGTVLIGKKAGKQFSAQQIITIQVQNRRGFLSEPLSFYTGCPES